MSQGKGEKKGQSGHRKLKLSKETLKDLVANAPVKGGRAGTAGPGRTGKSCPGDCSF